jgi:hypothetical protein
MYCGVAEPRQYEISSQVEGQEPVNTSIKVLSLHGCGRLCQVSVILKQIATNERQNSQAVDIINPVL